MKYGVLEKHPIEISKILLQLETDDVLSIFRYPDELKNQSWMTRFSIITPEEVFLKVLDKFCQGEKDPKTIDILNATNEK